MYNHPYIIMQKKAEDNYAISEQEADKLRQLREDSEKAKRTWSGLFGGTAGGAMGLGLGAATRTENNNVQSPLYRYA
jgi:hypothetical protein